MKLELRSLSSLALAVTVAGCGSSHSAEPDAGITFDATPPMDTGMSPDAGPPAPTTDVGSGCEVTSDCDSGICIGMGFPGGYCTAPCGAGGADCPDGSICTPVGRGMALCLARCDPAAPERTCRMGYGCASDFMLPAPVCLPGCTNDTDCDSGLACDPMGGFIGAGSCYDPASGIGDACTGGAECPSMSFCLSEGDSGWPGGACLGFGCDPASGSGCPGDAVCLTGGGGGGGHGVCVDGCTTDTDCRAGFACAPADEYPDRRYCAPACSTDAQCTDGRVCNAALGTCDSPFDTASLGRACSSNPDRLCTGGTCRSEFDSGYPDSYCFHDGCDTAAPDPGAAGCPGDGVCVPADGGSFGTCLDGCASASDCTREGYACSPSDPADPTSPTACVPACTTDASCANMGFVCNPGTGLCRPAFDTMEIGTACDGPDTCSAQCSRHGGCASGGVCIREQDDGWPAGTCTFPGCRLGGTGPAATCPVGGVCVDDGAGDPDIGVCLASCTVGMSGGCRAGYGCVDEGGGAGACRPACTGDADCSGGRTCDTMTGLCG